MARTKSVFGEIPAWFPRTAPFMVYMTFVAAAEIGGAAGIFPQTPEALTALYPLKAGCTAVALVFCVRRCPELRWRDALSPGDTLLSLLAGLAAFILWIHLDAPWSRFGSPVPFAPETAPPGPARFALLACRFIGAFLVVPLAEELFWRSWLIRAIEAKDFRSVPVGRPHFFSFCAVNVLFALEHHLVLAGLGAGVTYTLVLYRTRSVVHCVIAHATTNGLLGIWVMATGNWAFW